MGDITLFGLPISLGTMIYQAIIFTILVFILKKFVLIKLVDILDKRKEHIEEQLKLTEKYKFEAKVNFEDSEGILKQAKIEAREIIKHSENQAKQLIQEAKDEVKQIKKTAKDEAFRTNTRTFPQNTQIKGA
ncbi:ATP synthase F0 subunit B [Neobacillus sp. MM2021_6]|uniref:ATP synthase F0 subunit B n=1 Tax=Bacillaceae TaxID=186817 RepID=UPI00140831AF|nr:MULTISPECIES: ATP synthase F0 subunit B [Bacillaceae]MBO0961287.1 ATP synthase F0 subunit B [Neobacillus sp. MM2021_6]NHC18821.1 ATP synthase F0 subunit B [Bacillus sp. MM2020_4]